MRIALAALLLALVPVAAGAATLPSRLAPDAPFPRILEEAPTIETIAPGVEYGDYPMLTSVGPLVIRVIAADLHRSDVHAADVLADDRLTSPGETVGSMAQRSAAIAGINGDYYDIGNTNRPTNMVVRDGVLMRMPRKRYALAIGRDGTARLAEFSFMGQVEIGDRTLALDAVDDLPPPDGGVSLITPVFGNATGGENVTMVGLQLLAGTPPLARYRVTGVVDNLAPQPAGYYLAIGPNAYGIAGVPDDGTVVTASGDLAPMGLDSMVSAIGGGPLILHDGAWFDDPDGPNGGEYGKRIPSTGVALTPDGTLLLIEVDGRQASLSVGLERREFSALMRALGATEGMAVDGGGSSTIAVRRLGDAEASMQNSPSDGKERPVANGLFVFSTAPNGPPARLVARPGVVRAVTGAEVALRIAAVDTANHVVAGSADVTATISPASLGMYEDGRFTALQPGIGRLTMHADGLTGEIGIEVVRTPARVTIVPVQPHVESHGTLELAAHAYDDRGYALTVPALLPWNASEGSVDARGLYHATSRNATVGVSIGSAATLAHVTVGSHEVSLPFAEHAHFTTAPRGGAGGVTRGDCGSCVELAYSFASSERAAYATAEIPLPAGTIGLSFDVQDDGSDARLRVALRNSINEDLYVDATPLDQTGWRHVVVHFPAESASPTKLVAIYVLPPKGMQEASGQIELRNVRAVVSGGGP
jgi:Phosphodiester glycosidase